MKVRWKDFVFEVGSEEDAELLSLLIKKICEVDDLKRKHETKLLNRQCASKSSRVYVCPICGKAFTSSQAYAGHRCWCKKEKTSEESIPDDVKYFYNWLIEKMRLKKSTALSYVKALYCHFNNIKRYEYAIGRAARLYDKFRRETGYDVFGDKLIGLIKENWGNDWFRLETFLEVTDYDKEVIKSSFDFLVRSGVLEKKEENGMIFYRLKEKEEETTHSENSKNHEDDFDLKRMFLEEKRVMEGILR